MVYSEAEISKTGGAKEDMRQELEKLVVHSRSYLKDMEEWTTNTHVIKFSSPM